MNQGLLIVKAAYLINQASERTAAGFPKLAEARLVELRELLNNQPKLEAGGANRTKKEKKK